MKISEENRKKAVEIRHMISKLDPEVLYALADFMDIEGFADDGMQSRCVYEAMEKADVHSTDGSPQKYFMFMGMALPTIKVQCNFQDIGDGMYETDIAEILK